MQHHPRWQSRNDRPDHEVPKYRQWKWYQMGYNSSSCHLLDWWRTGLSVPQSIQPIVGGKDSHRVSKPSWTQLVCMLASTLPCLCLLEMVKFQFEQLLDLFCLLDSLEGVCDPRFRVWSAKIPTVVPSFDTAVDAEIPPNTQSRQWSTQLHYNRFNLLLAPRSHRLKMNHDPWQWMTNALSRLLRVYGFWFLVLNLGDCTYNKIFSFHVGMTEFFTTEVLVL